MERRNEEERKETEENKIVAQEIKKEKTVLLITSNLQP